MDNLCSIVYYTQVTAAANTLTVLFLHIIVLSPEYLLVFCVLARKNVVEVCPLQVCAARFQDSR